MARVFFATLCVVAALLPVGIGMGAAQAAPAPTVDPAPECDSLSEYETTEEYRNCLADHTTTEEVMAITSEAPANVSTKATDAVYAVDVEAVNDTVGERVTDWMTWEMFGVEPGWIDEARDAVDNATAANATTSTPTPTATPTATSTNSTRSAAPTSTATPNTSSTPTATSTPNASAGAEVEGGAGGTVADTMANTEDIRMGEHTSIVGWEFGDGEVRIAIDTERTQRVTITDGAAGVGEAGASTIPRVEERIFGGEISVVSMPVEEAFGGHVVGVAVGDSGVRLSTTMDASGDDPLRHFGGQSGLISGIGITILTSLGGAWYVLWKEEDGVMEA